MRYSYYILLPLLLLPALAAAQYQGGPGDGHDRAAGSITLMTFDLTGIYGGGSGDGFDRADGTISLMAFDIANIYNGGSGDGFDRADGTIKLMAFDIANIYNGGSGDGFDRADGTISLMAFDIANIYNGGSGDGFDRADGTISLMAFDIANIYNGGSGDGFDRADGAISLMAFDIANIYNGGSGDGFDRADGTIKLMAFDIANIYNGGSGDGFDRADGSVLLMAFDLTGIYGGGVGDGFSTSSSEEAALPLTLLAFTATAGDKEVFLNWVTENEVNTDFFTVERTKDGRTFTELSDVVAAGSSEPGEHLGYTLTDPAPLTGTSYYRLRSVDFDGSVQLSGLREVEFTGEAGDWSFSMYPNPNAGDILSIELDGSAKAQVLVRVTDLVGREVLRRVFTTSEGSALQLEFARGLAAGGYLVFVGGAGELGAGKVLVVE